MSIYKKSFWANLAAQIFTKIHKNCTRKFFSAQCRKKLEGTLHPPPPIFLQADTQSSWLLRSTCPNHLNLPRLTTSAMLCTPRRLYKSTLRFWSFSDTPLIHLTIIHSILSRLCRFAFFIAQVSVPYVNALWTQALYIFPFMRYDAPWAVKIGDNSLNFAQAISLWLLLPPPHLPHYITIHYVISYASYT